ncbi:MAG: glycine cleavage system protein GcvH [Actinobacteria bacterium]|nr:glycine cleavage system protein GcvH [Actinomycetota bacterium]
MTPGELRYTSSHEWIRDETDGTVTFGITEYAQHALGDIVFVALPSVGSTLSAGDSCGEIESTKSVSEIYAPVSGEIVAVNGELETRPERVNAEPYGGGWFARMHMSDAGQWGQLLSAADYEALTASA